MSFNPDSVVRGLFFYGIGFGMYCKLQRFEIYFVVLAVWTIEIMEPCLVTIFSFWANGMVVAQPDLLEKTTIQERTCMIIFIC